MIVIGGGGGNVGDGGGGVGGDGMGAESIDPARKETCSGKELKATAHVIPRPSQSKTKLPLFGDWMVQFCTNVCTILTIRSWLALLASLDASVAVCIAFARLLPSIWRQRCDDGCHDSWICGCWLGSWWAG
jgi:hypothetical protein